MKRKIKVIDNVSGKVLEEETEIRNLDHFEVQRKTRAHIFRDRTKYTRKRKHSAKLIDED